METQLTKKDSKLKELAEKFRKKHSAFLNIGGKLCVAAKECGEVLIEMQKANPALGSNRQLAGWLNLAGVKVCYKTVGNYIALAANWEQIVAEAKARGLDLGELGPWSALQLVKPQKPRIPKQKALTAPDNWQERDGGYVMGQAELKSHNGKKNAFDIFIGGKKQAVMGGLKDAKKHAEELLARMKLPQDAVVEGDNSPPDEELDDKWTEDGAAWTWGEYTIHAERKGTHRIPVYVVTKEDDYGGQELGSFDTLEMAKDRAEKDADYEAVKKTVEGGDGWTEGKRGSRMAWYKGGWCVEHRPENKWHKYKLWRTENGKEVGTQFLTFEEAKKFAEEGYEALCKALGETVREEKPQEEAEKFPNEWHHKDNPNGVHYGQRLAGDKERVPYNGSTKFLCGIITEGQHEPRFTDNGNLEIFDSYGQKKGEPQKLILQPEGNRGGLVEALERAIKKWKTEQLHTQRKAEKKGKVRK
jgi:hypothetical protein